MFCSKCGTNNPEGAAFCAGCGSPLTTAQQPVQQQTYTQQPINNAQDYSQQQYVQPTYAGQYQEIQQPKKKSKKGLIIGAACGGVAVITAGTLVLTLGQSSIMRSVMGDVEYAKSVNTRFLSDNFSRYTGIAKSAAQNSSNVLAPAKNLLSTSLLSKNSGGASYANVSATDYLNDIGDYFKNDNSQNDDVYSKYDSSMVQAASAVYMLADMIDSISRDGLTVSVGLNAELGKKLLELFPPEYNDIIDDVKAVLSSSDFAIGMSRKDGALAYSLYFRRNGSNFVGAVVQISEDGQITVAFPEATKRAITIKIPSAKELGLEDTFDKEAEPILSEKDIERLTDEITKAYLSCYEYADISYQDGEIDIDGNSTGCTVITATFDSYNIGMIIGKVVDVIEQDESAKKVLDKLGGENFLSGMIDYMRSWEKDAKERTPDIKLVVESYVNSANQPLGVKYTLGNEQDNYVFSSVDNGSYGRTAVEINGSPLFELVDRKSGGSSGKAVFTFYPYAMSPYYSSNSGYSLSVNIDYKDVGTFKAFGQETLGGTYTISIAESEFLKSALSGFSSGGFDIYGILTGLSFTVSMKEYNGGIEESAGFTVEDYGSLNVIARAVPRADIPAVPNDIIPIELGSDNSSDELQALVTDILNYCSDKFKSDGQLNKLDEDFERITGQKISGIFTSSMKGYTDKSRVNAANYTASYIRNTIDIALTDADTAGYGMKWYDAKCLVTGIVDGNGKWELMLSDLDGFNSSSSGKWEKSATATANESKRDTDNASKKLAIELANMFPDLKNCCFEAYLANGRCVAIWFTNSTDSPSLVSGFYGGVLTDEYGWKDYGYSWNGTTAGITNEGYVVGTYPQLGLKY